MRHVYLDESGTGDPEREPDVIVCAIIIHPDKQWKNLREYLADMAAHFVPEDKKSQFKGFHANELYAGGKIFERDKENFEKWWPVLDELVSLPSKFDLPVIFGTVKRASVEQGGMFFDHVKNSGFKPVVAAQIFSFAQTCMGVEHWMNSAAEADEVIEMIMENNMQTQELIKGAQRFITDPRKRVGLTEEMQGLLNISRIIWPINFQPKDESSILQISDACAWAIRRRLAGNPDSDRFFDPLMPYIINVVEPLPPVAIRVSRASP